MNSDLTSLIVLVVEDENLLRWAIRKKLEDCGCKVLDAATCTEALEISARNRIDLLVSDFRLDDGFGDDLARKIDKGLGYAGVLLMSGESEGLSRDDFAGVDLIAIMTKPVDLDDLVEVVKGWTVKRSGPVQENSFAGIFKVLRPVSLDETVKALKSGIENIAFELQEGGFGGVEDIVIIRLIKENLSPGRRFCVVAEPGSNILQVCRREGVEFAASVSDLEALSRRMVSGAERSAVLALTLQDES